MDDTDVNRKANNNNNTITSYQGADMSLSGNKNDTSLK